MSVEFNINKPAAEIRAADAPAAEQNAREAAVLEADEAAYEAEVTKEPRNQFSVDYSKLQALSAAHHKGFAAFQKMVAALMDKQGKGAQSAFKSIFGKDGDFTGVTNLKDVIAGLEVDDATRAEAAELIGENGAYGVKQLSQSILGMAQAGSGGDPGKLEAMKQSFLKGFADAERIWGGSLPSICYETKEAMLKGFSELAGSSSSSAVD